MSAAFDEAYDLVGTVTTYENKDYKTKRLKALELKITDEDERRHYAELWEAFIVESNVNAP